jgi:hypothetical protein
MSWLICSRPNLSPGKAICCTLHGLIVKSISAGCIVNRSNTIAVAPGYFIFSRSSAGCIGLNYSNTIAITMSCLILNRSSADYNGLNCTNIIAIASDCFRVDPRGRVDPGVMLGPPQRSIFLNFQQLNSNGFHQKRLI